MRLRCQKRRSAYSAYNDAMKSLCLVFLIFCSVVSADEIVLKNGKVVEGTIWKEIGGTVILKGPDGILLNIKKDEIDAEKTVEKKKSGSKSIITPAKNEREKPPKEISREYLESLRGKYDLGEGSFGESYKLDLPVTSRSKAYSIADDPDFERIVLKASKPVLVDFWAEWCGPCRQIAPRIEAVEKEFAERAVVHRVNIDEKPDLARFYKVYAIPTLLFFDNGEQVDRIVGAASQDVISDRLKALVVR